jgi:exonuclease III
VCLSEDISNPKMALQNSLRVSTFNCRSLKSSVTEICELCDSSDLVFLQEHWLLPFELGLLNNIHSNFFAVSKSAVDTTRDVLVGRPYGGTAILFRKELAACITTVDVNDPRLCVIKFDSNMGPILFACVYMPFDQGDAECLENFIEICAKLNALYSELDAVHFVIVGDFNCQFGSRFYNVLQQWVSDLNLQLSDIKRLDNAFTYCSDDGLRSSWIDHCICSNVVDQLISHIEVLCQYITSDHKPVMIVFNGICGTVCASSNSIVEKKDIFYDWSKADAYCLHLYKVTLNELLSHVDIPSDILTNSFCKNFDVVIQKYYDAVMSSITEACHLTIPRFTQKSHRCAVPGWNDYVDEKHF